jgi:2-oxoisovalerate dehydrogenase E2 component (dihydrolipoyl transacylase)
VQLRERTKEEFLRTEGVSLTYLPFFVQAIVAALTEHPLLNATYTDAGIEVHDRYDMGIAVAIEQGLLVPIVRDADQKSVAAMAREINDLGNRARERRLHRDEMQGATHTIDNTGAFGSLISQPIVPRGQVAIITTEAIRRELRPRDDAAFAVRSVMNLCVSFDHRALDGAQVGRYMQSVKSHLEAFQPHQDVP